MKLHAPRTIDLPTPPVASLLLRLLRFPHQLAACDSSEERIAALLDAFLVFCGAHAAAVIPQSAEAAPIVQANADAPYQLLQHVLRQGAPGNQVVWQPIEPPIAGFHAVALLPSSNGSASHDEIALVQQLIAAVHEIETDLHKEETLERQRRITRVLAEAASPLLTSAPAAMRAALETTIAALGESVGFELVALALGANSPIEANTRCLWQRAEPVEAPSFEWLQSLNVHCLNGVLNVAALAPNQQAWLAERGIETAMVLPIMVQEATHGLLLCGSREKQASWINELSRQFYLASGMFGHALTHCLMRENVRRSDMHYRTLVRNLPDTAVYLFDQDMRFLVADGQVFDHVHIDASDLEGRTCDEVSGSIAIRDQIVAWYRDALRGEVVTNVAHIGSRWFDTTVLPVIGSENEIIGGMAVVRNITVQRQIEQSLREQTERLRAIFASASVGMMLLDRDERIHELNEFAAKLLGREGEVLVGRQAVDVLPSTTNYALFREQVELAAYGVQRVEYGFHNQLGQNIWVDLSLTALNDEQGERIATLLVGVDITERRAHEQRLRMLETAILNIGDGVLIVDSARMHHEQSPVVFFNQALLAITGLDPDTLLSVPLDRVCVIDGDERALERLFLAAERGEHGRTEVRCHRTDGTHFWAVIDIVPVTLPNVETNHWVIVLHDTTKRRETEDTLRNQERMLRSIGDNMPNGMIYQIHQTPDGVMSFRYISAGVTQIAGVTPEEAMRNADLVFNATLNEDRERVADFVEASLATMTPFDQVVRKRYADDSMHWSHIRLQPRPSDDGGVIWEGFELDVTDRHVAEEAVRTSQRRLQAIIDNAPVIISTSDLQGRFTQVNRLFLDAFHRLDSAEVLGRSFPEVQIGNSRAVELDESSTAQVVKTGAVIGYEVAKLVPNDDRIWLMQKFPLRNAYNDITALGVIATDITERRRAVHALAESEERYRLLFEHSMDAIVLADRKGHITQVNAAAYELLGYAEHTLLGRDVIELLGSAAEPLIQQIDSHLPAQRVYLHGELELPRANGETFISEYVVCMVTPHLYMAILRDITRRKQAEWALRDSYDELEQRVAERTAELTLLNQELAREIREHEASEERYRTLIETSPSAILVTDRQGLVQLCNRQAADLFGYNDPIGLFGVCAIDLIDSSEVANVDQIFLPDQVRNLECMLIRRDGTRFYAEVSSTVVPGHANNPDMVIIVARDITEQKSAEEAVTRAYNHVASLNRHLRHSRSLLQALFDGLEDGLLLLDEHGRVQVVNRTMALLLGCEPECLLHRDWQEAFQEIAPEFPGLLALQIRAPGRQRYERLRYVGATASPKILDIQVIALGELGHTDQTIVHVTDVTDTVRLQDQVLRAEHFAASGRLAASVAHEISTPLQTIQTNIRLLQHTAPPEQRAFLADALEEIRRVGRIVRQLLDFYRPAASTYGSVDLADVIERILLLLGKRLRDQRIEIQRQISADTPPIHGRADELTQVMLNLVVNALDAMPNGGVLSITIEQDNAKHSHVMVQVGDSGHGIDETMQARLFEPFVTTKENGTGLGLSICKQIVEQHHGTIALANADKGGCVCTVVFPVNAAANQPSTEHSS